MNVPTVTFVLGTRPEAIKLAPLIAAFKEAKIFKVRLVLTGQHKEMVNQVMDFFNLKGDKDLNLMKEKQSLNHIATSVLGISKNLKHINHDFLYIGDTTQHFLHLLQLFTTKFQ